jgi:hypothetical protein
MTAFCASLCGVRALCRSCQNEVSQGEGGLSLVALAGSYDGVYIREEWCEAERVPVVLDLSGPSAIS